jgi:bifunctional DNA-binding transcriptional regulator/antitoxin component of YhaV-PrlF toxin-antitoxin module
VTGTVTKVTVTLLNLTHSFLDDIAVLLLGPGGQSVLLFDGLGAVDSVVSVDLTFDDAAPTQLTSPVVTGSYQPGLDLYGDTFSPPAPLRPYGTTMSVFNGINANGTWMLFIQDFVTESNGSLGDWRIDITTLDDVPEPASFALAGAGLLLFAVVRFCPSSWTPKVRRYLTFTKTTVSSKGQIVLPAEFRRMDRVEPGQEFDAERLERGDNRLSPLLQQLRQPHFALANVAAAPVRRIPAALKRQLSALAARRGSGWSDSAPQTRQAAEPRPVPQDEAATSQRLSGSPPPLNRLWRSAALRPANVL